MYSSIDLSAVRPAPMARMTVAAPVTASPPAKRIMTNDKNVIPIRIGIRCNNLLTIYFPMLLPVLSKIFLFYSYLKKAKSASLPGGYSYILFCHTFPFLLFHMSTQI